MEGSLGSYTPDGDGTRAALDVDREERQLAALAEALNCAISGEDRLAAQTLMSRLLVEARMHFVHEERLLCDAGYPRAQGHAAIHLQIAAELEHARAELERTRLPALRTAYGLLVLQLIAEHHAQESRAFKSYLQRERPDAVG